MRNCLFVLLAICLSWTSGAFAQSYPNYDSIYVNDFAAILPDSDEKRIRSKLVELTEHSGVEFTVVTISQLADYGYIGPIEPFATGLFNDWGVGNAERNDGVMMLIATQDRLMRIEVGSGYGLSQNDAMKGTIDDTIVPHFRDNDYVTGIEAGVDMVIYHLTGNWPGEYNANAAQKAVWWLQRMLESLGSWIYAILAPLLAIPLRMYRRWRRNKPRYCPRDGFEMVRLDEQWDDTQLQNGQITEERLRSVDYDVWDCPKCDHVTIEGYKAWFSQYGACRSCGYKTVEGDTTILSHATKSSTGEKRIDYHCHHCQDSWSAYRTIAKLSSSSSSSSSSFGGGSSSGGGASGSW